MILYEDDALRVSQGWLTGWRVLDKQAGTTVVPTRAQAERIGLLWHRIRKVRRAASISPRFTEDRMFEAFGWAVLLPQASPGLAFLADSAEAQAETIIRNANDALRRARQAGDLHDP